MGKPPRRDLIGQTFLGRTFPGSRTFPDRTFLNNFLVILFSRYKIESRIADAICKNKTVVKIGLKFQFTEVYDRISKQLIDNIDRLRKERVKNEGPSQVKWKPPKTID